MAFIKANEEFDEYTIYNSEKNKTTGYYLSEPVVATLKLLHRNHNSATKHIKLMFSGYE